MALADQLEAPTNKTQLQLPFEGRWFCYWGGSDPVDNWHSGSRSQRFGYDFVAVPEGTDPVDVLDSEKNFYKNKVILNENSFSYRRNILAPAAGQVVMAQNTMPDRRPTKNLKPADRIPGTLGNFVMIMHRYDEFSVLAHLRQNSLTVQPGDEVEIGQKVGECGNSGYTTDPHLHFHLQDSPVLADWNESGDWENDKANGIRAGFAETVLERNGMVLMYSNPRYPVRGDFVTPN